MMYLIFREIVNIYSDVIGRVQYVSMNRRCRYPLKQFNPGGGWRYDKLYDIIMIILQEYRSVGIQETYTHVFLTHFVKVTVAIILHIIIIIITILSQQNNLIFIFIFIGFCIFKKITYFSLYLHNSVSVYDVFGTPRFR